MGKKGRKKNTGNRNHEGDVATEGGAFVYGDGSAGRDINTRNYINVSGLAAALPLRIPGENSQKAQLEEKAERDSRIKALDYISRREREFQLENHRARKETFDWIWERQSRRDRTPGFYEWLAGSNEAKLFWIQGKPGSGKSTLMHHLATSSSTVTEILTSSGSPLLKWVIVHFYFDFRARDTVANDVLGCLRSLILQICERGRIPLPQIPNFDADPTLKERPVALQKILFELLLETQENFILFLDGLDEFSGDWVQLEPFLLDLQEFTCDNIRKVKVCVASRPDIPMTFRRSTGFSMQNCNMRAIELYADYMFQKLPEEVLHSALEDPQSDDPQQTSEFRCIFRNIVSRAQGVFLWAEFAMHEIIAGVYGGLTATELQSRLLALPDVMNDMYGRIFERLHTKERLEALQMLMLVISYDDLSDRFSSTESCLSLDILLIAMRIINIAPLDHNGNLVIDTTKLLRMNVTSEDSTVFRRRLETYCGGMLDLNAARNDQRPGILQIRICHETVMSFIREEWASTDTSALAVWQYGNPWIPVVICSFAISISQAAKALPDSRRFVNCDGERLLGQTSRKPTPEFLQLCFKEQVLGMIAYDAIPLLGNCLDSLSTGSPELAWRLVSRTLSHVMMHMQSIWLNSTDEGELTDVEYFATSAGPMSKMTLLADCRFLTVFEYLLVRTHEAEDILVDILCEILDIYTDGGGYGDSRFRGPDLLDGLQLLIERDVHIDHEATRSKLFEKFWSVRWKMLSHFYLFPAERRCKYSHIIRRIAWILMPEFTFKDCRACPDGSELHEEMKYWRNASEEELLQFARSWYFKNL